MADILQFKKGLVAGLNSVAKKAGTIYVTTDERAMYVDIDDNTRIRLGDFIEVANVKALEDAKYLPYSQTALYYAAEENVLLKYKGLSADGSHAEFTTINSTATIKNDITNLKAADVAHDNAIEANATAIKSLQDLIGADNGGLAGKVDTLEDALDTHKEEATEEFAAVRSELAAEKEALAGQILAINNQLPNKANASDLTALQTTVAENKTAAETAVSNLTTSRIVPLETDVGTLKTTVAGHGESIAALQNAANSYALKTEVEGIVTDRIVPAETKIATLQEQVGKAKEGSTAATGLFKDVADLKDTDTSHDSRIAALENAAPSYAAKTTVEELTQTVANNKTAIEQTVSDLTTNRVAPLETKVGTLETNHNGVADRVTAIENALPTTYVKVADYNTKVQEIANKDSAQDGRLDSLENIVGTDAEKGLRAAVTAVTSAAQTNADNISAINNQLPQITTNKNDIAAINQAIGTKEDTADTTIYGYINSSFAAADAMKFMGDVNSYAALLLKTDVEAGHTYVLTARDETSVEDTIYAAGDLFIALNDGDNQNWVHVPSGYVPGLESLTGTNNSIIMLNHNGAAVGSITVEAVADSAITATVANNKLTIGMEWGSF